MPRTEFVIIAAVLFASSASANEAWMQTRFGNTMISQSRSGGTVKMYYRADHTMTGLRDGEPYSGTWEVKGDRLCITIEPNPLGRPNPNCIQLVLRQVGSAWQTSRGIEYLVEGIH